MGIVQLDRAYQRQSSPETERERHERLFRHHTVAFRLRTRRLVVEPHAGSLSIKTVFSGVERYEFEDRISNVKPGEILLVRPDVTYSSSIRTSQPTDSFSLFLPSAFAKRHFGSPAVSNFLDSGLSSTALPGLSVTALALKAIADALEDERGLAAEAALAAIGEQLGPSVQPMSALGERLDGDNARTRAEMLKRMLTVRDHLHASPAGEVSLASVARLVGLSEFHLMRCFRQCFGTSIGQYHLHLRMERAASLLAERRYPIAEVARRCGYRNHSAFGRAFRRHWGRAPGAFPE